MTATTIAVLLDEYKPIIMLGIPILVIILLLVRNSKRSPVKDAELFFKDLLNIFYSGNYTVTLWFTFLIVLSIVLGLLGLMVGRPAPNLPCHSHWVVLEIIFLWALLILSLKRLVNNTYIRSLLFVGISITGLLLCFRFFNWPEKYQRGDPYGYIIGIASFMVSAIGIFISIRVFMQIDSHDKSNSLDRYLEETISIVKNADKGDEIYIIGPCFCPGITGNPYLLNLLFETIDKKSQRGTIFHFAFPNIGNKKMFKVKYDSKSKTNSKAKSIDQRPTKDYHWKLLCSIADKKFEDNIDDMINRIYKSSSSYYRQLVNVVERNDKNSLKWLNLDYINEKRHTSNNINIFSGFYASANVRLSDARKEKGANGGDCLIGTFYVSDAKLFFTGSSFVYPNQNNNLQHFLEGECLDYCDDCYCRQ